MYTPSRRFAFFILGIFLCAGLLQAIPASPVLAQEEQPVQELQGKINPGEIDVFVLSGLKQGQTLYVTLETHLREPGPGPVACAGLRTDLPELDRHLPGGSAGPGTDGGIPAGRAASPERQIPSWPGMMTAGQDTTPPWSSPSRRMAITSWAPRGRFLPPGGSPPATTACSWGWMRRKCWPARQSPMGRSSPSRTTPA